MSGSGFLSLKTGSRVLHHSMLGPSFAGASMVEYGTVRTWIPARGFGFIARDSREPDIFVHVSSLLDGMTELKIGQPVTFTVSLTRDGRTRAIDVKLR